MSWSLAIRYILWIILREMNGERWEDGIKHKGKPSYNAGRTKAPATPGWGSGLWGQCDSQSCLRLSCSVTGSRMPKAGKLWQILMTLDLDIAY
jgi:hypothetical protein